MKKHNWLFSVATLALLLALGGTGYVISASPSDASNGQMLDGNSHQSQQSSGATDGLEHLPLGMQGTTYRTLVFAGAVKPVHLDLKPDPNAKFQGGGGTSPSSVTWGSEVNTSGPGSSEPDGKLHPTDPANLLVSGNLTLDTSHDGGQHWSTLYPPWGLSTIDDVAAFAPGSQYQNTAIAAGLVNCNPFDCQLAAGRSTDRGVTWQSFSPVGFNSPSYFNDRPDLWADKDPASPFYGRMYLTLTLRDPQGSGSFQTVATKYSTDSGASWSQDFLQSDPSTYLADGAQQFGSMAFGPNGKAYAGWLVSRCCSIPRPPIDVPNKHMWARSTDGGVTFPISGTAAIDAVARSVIFNSASPAGFNWSAQTDIGVDPVDGTMYMAWLRFRQDIPEGQVGDGAAVFITSSTDQGATWSTPTTVHNDSDSHATQYFP